MSLRDNIITIGTDVGVIWYYDIRAGYFLQKRTFDFEVALKSSCLIPVSIIICSQFIIIINYKFLILYNM